jgi:hypothetical protein
MLSEGKRLILQIKMKKLWLPNIILLSYRKPELNKGTQNLRKQPY